MKPEPEEPPEEGDPRKLALKRFREKKKEGQYEDRSAEEGLTGFYELIDNHVTVFFNRTKREDDVWKLYLGDRLVGQVSGTRLRPEVMNTMLRLSQK